MNSLPFTTPSALIRLAVEDARQILKTPGYELDMTKWHEANPLKGGTCRVCLAGAIMARTLDCDMTDDLSPTSFERSTRAQLLAVDAFRKGHVRAALIGLFTNTNVRRDNPELAKRMEVAAAEEYPVNVQRALDLLVPDGMSALHAQLKLADALEEVGL